MMPISASDHDPRGIVASLLGEQAQVEAQHPVSAHLQQHAGQQDRSGGRRFHVRVWQPRVERKQRNLDRERQEEAEEEPLRRGREVRHSTARDLIANHDEIEAAGMRVQPQNRRQHKHRRDHGVHEEFHGGIDLALVPENADQQRHRDQRGFPEEIEEEEIEGSEDADQRGLQDQQQNEKFLYPVVHRLPRDQHAQRREERGQNHQPQRDAVDAHVVVNVGRRNPLAVDFVLESWHGAMEVHRQVQRREEK